MTLRYVGRVPVGERSIDISGNIRTGQVVAAGLLLPVYMADVVGGAGDFFLLQIKAKPMKLVDPRLMRIKIRLIDIALCVDAQIFAGRHMFQPHLAGLDVVLL